MNISLQKQIVNRVNTRRDHRRRRSCWQSCWQPQLHVCVVNRRGDSLMYSVAWIKHVRFLCNCNAQLVADTWGIHQHDQSTITLCISLHATVSTIATCIYPIIQNHSSQMTDLWPRLSLQFTTWLPFHRSSAKRANTPSASNVTSKPRHNTDSYVCGAGKNISIAS